MPSLFDPEFCHKLANFKGEELGEALQRKQEAELSAPSAPAGVSEDAIVEDCTRLAGKLQALPEDLMPHGHGDDSREWTEAWRDAYLPLMTAAGEALEVIRRSELQKRSLGKAVRDWCGRASPPTFDRMRMAAPDNYRDAMRRTGAPDAPKNKYPVEQIASVLKTEMEGFMSGVEDLCRPGKIVNMLQFTDQLAKLGEVVTATGKLCLEVQEQCKLDGNARRRALRDLSRAVRQTLGDHFAQEKLNVISRTLLEEAERQRESRHVQSVDSRAGLVEHLTRSLSPDTRRRLGRDLATEGSESPGGKEQTVSR